MELVQTSTCCFSILVVFLYSEVSAHDLICSYCLRSIFSGFICTDFATGLIYVQGIIYILNYTGLVIYYLRVYNTYFAACVLLLILYTVYRNFK